MFDFQITTSWDGTPLDHDPINIKISRCGEDVKMEVNTPKFDGPNPGTPSGEPCPELWDRGDVVEAFFLGEGDKYLEVELCPHGQHIVLMLNGCRNCFKEQLPLHFQANISGDTWSGCAIIPRVYFPPKVSRFNAFSIYKNKGTTQFAALYTQPKGKHENPDFHRLEYFQDMGFKTFLPENWTESPSEYWTNC